MASIGQTSATSAAAIAAPAGDIPTCTPVAGKKRPRAPAKPRAPKSVRGVSDGAWAKLSDSKELKKEMKGHVKMVWQLVDADWHDGYEEQSAEVMEFFRMFKPVLEAVLELSRASDVPAGAYERGNEALFILADAADEMRAIDFRGDLSEDYSNSGFKLNWKEGEASFSMEFYEPDSAVAWAWRALLRSAAGAGGRVSDELLLRYMRDASDHCFMPDLVKDDDHSAEEGSQIPGGEAGRERLKALIDGKRFEALKSRAKKYKTRRAIDRRYSGAKHRRTRDYSSGSDGCFDL
eukprot:tig00000806_g4366.t1